MKPIKQIAHSLSPNTKNSVGALPSTRSFRPRPSHCPSPSRTGNAAAPTPCMWTRSPIPLALTLGTRSRGDAYKTHPVGHLHIALSQDGDMESCEVSVGQEQSVSSKRLFRIVVAIAALGRAFTPTARYGSANLMINCTTCKHSTNYLSIGCVNIQRQK